MCMFITTEATQGTETTKHHFTNKDADDNDNKETTIASHDDQHEQVIDKGCQCCEEAAYGVDGPSEGWYLWQIQGFWISSIVFVGCIVAGTIQGDGC